MRPACTIVALSTWKARGSTRGVLALPPSTRCRSAAAEFADGLPLALDSVPAPGFCMQLSGTVRSCPTCIHSQCYIRSTAVSGPNDV